jgi:hypothetical protein
MFLFSFYKTQTFMLRYIITLRVLGIYVLKKLFSEHFTAVFMGYLLSASQLARILVGNRLSTDRSL